MCPWTGSAPNQTFSRTDGTRTGSETWQEADANDVAILSTAHDTHDEDLADGIELCLKKDGGTQPTAAIPWNNQRITGYGVPAARTDVQRVDKVQDAAHIFAAGTGDDTITASLSPAITGYATGMIVAIKLADANSGAATLNLNSVGAAAIKKGLAGDDALDANDLKAGRIGLFAYDGTNMQMLNAPEFPGGTKMLFWQTTPPTGWTKDTNHNDKALRVTSGTASTGGSVAFETAFASKSVAGTIGGTAISVNQMPAHGHPSRVSVNEDNDQNAAGGIMLSDNDVSNFPAFTGTLSNTAGEQIGSTGGGATHDHSFTGTAINLDVSFVDVILATKD